MRRFVGNLGRVTASVPFQGGVRLMVQAPRPLFASPVTSSIPLNIVPPQCSQVRFYSSEEKDPYKILGVPRDATEKDIKKSFRKLALEYHPDANKGDEKKAKKFAEISQAYEILSDPKKRQNYDQFGSMGEEFGGFNPGEGMNMEEMFGGAFGSMFEDFLGFGRGGKEFSRGGDIVLEQHLSFEEAVMGCEKDVHFRALTSCSSCGGTGGEAGSAPVKCSRCKGQGHVVSSQGFGMVVTPCPQCGGSGSTQKNPCKTCDGQGVKKGQRTVKVKVPRGVENGSKIRVRGEGDHQPESFNSKRKPQPGDLHIVISVSPHSTFRRKGPGGMHIECDVEIPVEDAILGSNLSVKTLDSTENLRIQPGTQPGTIVSIPGKGSYSLRDQNRRGDFLCNIKIRIPTRLSDEKLRLMEEFKKAR